MVHAYMQGVGVLASSPLEDLNLGMNKLTSLPLEVHICTYICIYIVRPHISTIC